MRFGILGPLAVWTADGAPVRVPGRKVRALLADLLLHEGRPVPADRLIEDLWNGRRLPVDAPAALSAKVSQLRRVLEDAEAGARRLVVSGPAGYALQPAMGAVDVQRFRTLVGEAHRAEPSRAAALLAEALGLWRGAPLADLADAPFVGAVIARLVEQRLTAQEDHAELRLDLGEHAALVDDLGALVDEHPLRERLRATYLLALYRTGRQREALDSYRLLRARLADELGLDPSPELTALHHAILVRDPALDLRVGPRRASRGRAGNLPSPTTELIGREAAVDELRHRLNANRLITLTGPGGVGKTRLAVAVAAAATARFADGAWLVELAPIERARPGRPAPDLLGRLAEAVLTVLDVKDTAGVGHATGPVDRLRRALRSRELLLVLDNCEHVVAHAAELTALTLEAAPGLRVLATSREPLGLAGEVVWGVPPLATPDHGTDVATLQQFGAVQLFVARAKAAATGFTLRSDTAAAVAEVCRRLDGIPLALELAATKVRALGVAGLAARLDDRFRLLAAGRRGGPARQHTLRAVIEWSWELLGEPERIVLRRLAVHAGGATADAAQAVCAGADLPASDVVPVLIGLVDRSLVDVVDAGGEPRYRLLESVAAYSMERLREAGELERLRTRHADHYLRLVEQAQSEIRGPEQQRWLRRLDAEAANLRVALADARPELRLRLVIGLAWYWVLRGRLTEARRSIEAAQVGPDGAQAGLRAAAAAWHAGIVLRLGDTEGWEERRCRVLELVERIPDPVARARAHWFLGHCSIDYGDLEASAELLDRALTSCRTHADRWGEAAALASRCKLAHIHADLAALERDGDRAAQLFARLGDRWGLVQANGWLGALAEMVGDHERARRLCRDGLRLAEELGLWQEVCTAQAFLGWIALANRDYPLADRYGVRALRLAGEQGYRAGQVLAAIVLGYAARKDGRLDDAERHLHDVLDWTPHAEGNPASAVHLPMTLCELGFVAELRGDPATAAKLHREAYDLSQRLAGPRISVLALEGLAGALAIERPDPAARLLGAAAAARVAVGLPPAPAERGDVDRITAAVRTALGDVAFDAAFRAGRALTPTDARSLGEGND